MVKKPLNLYVYQTLFNIAPAFFIWSFQSASTQKYLLFQSTGSTLAFIFMMFIFCYFGNVVTTKSAAVADKAYQTMWYKYPVRMQPHIILIMMQSQKPFYLKGYELMLCSLQNFTWVSKHITHINDYFFGFFFWKIILLFFLQLMKTAASIFMVFRKIQ